MERLTALLVLMLDAAYGLTSPFKGYSGLRANNSSIRHVYYYEQAVAVVELGEKRLLYNCEIVEVYEPYERKKLLKSLEEIEKINKIFKIGFKSMLDLMNRCDEIEPLIPPGQSSIMSNHPIAEATETALNGILPGTKWCGNGDVATTFFDLGSEKGDKCCRKHDLCPIKVRASSSRYGITNKGFSMSHCNCDEEFSKCLVHTNTTVANIMGYLYFNVLKSPCLDGTIIRGLKLKHSQRYKDG